VENIEGWSVVSYNSDIFSRSKGDEVVKLIWQDALVVLALTFHFGALITTQFIIGTLENLTTVATNVERDPFARFMVNYQYGLFIITCISQGTLLTCYWYIRKKTLNDEINMFFLNAFTFITFYTFAMDFFGNAGIVGRILFG